MAKLMNNLYVKNWRWFKIGDLFEIEKCKNIKIVEAEENLGSDLPYITRSELNNGCYCFVNKSNFKLHKGNCITIGAEGAAIFYQPNDFITGNNVTRIYHPKMNENNGLFLVSVLKLEKYKYTYNRAFNKNYINKTWIKLPVDEFNQPNWEYMENYIKSLRERERENSELAQPYLLEKNQSDLDITNWKTFLIDEIFDIKNGYGITKDDIQNFKGNIPAIQGGDQNDGIIGCLKPNLKLLFINEPCLSLARVGSAGAINFFEDGCYIGDKAKALILKTKYNKHKIKSVYLFFKVILNANKFRFSYGRGIVSDKYKELKIVLPVKGNNEINFDYIECFMREREREEYRRLYDLYLK